MSVSALKPDRAHSPMVRELRQAIQSGRLAPEDRVAGEVSLGQQYGISVTSVRRGIGLLVRQGLLTRRQGSGTYVTAAAPATLAASPRPGSASRAPQVPMVKRDTIAIVQHTNVQVYHPYYSELHAGLRAGLGQHGWKVWEPAAGSSTGGDFALAPFDWDRDRLWSTVGEHAELAGMIVRPSLLPLTPGWRPSYPVVVPDAKPNLSYVAYDWELELEAGFRYLLERGARRLWALGVFAEPMFRRAADRAAGALGLASPALQLRRTSDQVRTLSESVQRAYAHASEDLAAMAAGEATACDGILVASDFEAQGVFDALAGSPLAARSDLASLAMTNRQSRLSLSPRVAQLVVDGYAQGEALADMLHQQIIQPNRAPRQVLLRGRLTEYVR